MQKKTEQEQNDQYEFLYSIIFEIKEIRYLEQLITIYPHYVNAKSKEGKHIFLSILEVFTETKDTLYLNSVLNTFLLHSRFHLENKENVFCMKLLKEAINKKNEKINDYIQILDILSKKEITEEHISNINQKYGIKMGFNILVKEELLPKKDYIITIDHKNTLDMDDALSIQKQGDFYLLNVYITNVAHFIKKDSYLDQEAFRRTESLYLSDKVVPMLPTELSNDRLSLNGNAYKNVYVYSIEIGKDGTIKDFSIKKDMILVDQKTTYEEVNHAIRQGKDDLFGKTCIDLSEMAYLLKQKNLDKTLYRVIEDIQNAGIYNDKNNYTNRTSAEIIVEETMLLINYLSAKLFYERGYPYIYRNHLEPDRILEDQGIRELKETIINKQKYMDILKNLSSMYPRPFYSINNEGHYGLNLRYYSHCSSPIRRYPDIIGQRLLEEYIFKVPTKETNAYWEANIEQICAYCNERMKTDLLYEKEYEKIKQLMKK